MGDIDETKHYFLSEELTRLETENHTPIQVVLDTDGGDVATGLALHDLIAGSAVPVDVLARGSVMSIGMIVLQAGRLRVATKNTLCMIHPMSVDMTHSVHSYSRLSEIHLATQDRMDRILSSRSHLNEEMLRAYSGDDYFYADEALKRGLIDLII